MNIILIGYRCSGKTSVGKVLAMRLRRDFLDTDVLIEEHAGRIIEEIISHDGWDRFRDLEKTVIRTISQRDNLVIATGGGVVMDNENVQTLKRNGFLVWLKADVDLLKERMNKEYQLGRNRPSLTGEDPRDEIEKVLHIRNPFYQKAGDMIVDTDTRSIREVADSILYNLPKGF